MAKLYSLVTRTADKAGDALERSEELRAAHVAAQVARFRAKGTAVSQRARDLAAALRGQLAALGPDVRSIAVQEIAAWAPVKIGGADADTLPLLAVDLELNQARTDARGVWWRRGVADCRAGSSSFRPSCTPGELLAIHVV